ncbi:MAG TPA: AAA family ATPase [Acidobacteriaceae bacterium]
MLRSLTLLHDRIADPQAYPFTVPAISSIETLEFSRSGITFFIGENGSGKSTLLEAIAHHYGFGREGGTRNFANSSTASNSSIDSLTRALRLAFDIRSGRGFFLRAESFFNTATHIDDLDRDDPEDTFRAPPLIPSYGGQSLHNYSHGESFFTLLEHKFRGDGLFLLDEPEAALSAKRQLAALSLIHETVRSHKDAQFIISTHSPILLAMPKAQILSFDGGQIRPIAYEETPSFQITRRLLADRASFMNQLLRTEPTLFDPEN